MATAAVLPHINPRQDFPAWLAAHGVSLNVAEAVDRELGIGDYEAFLACAEQPHIRAELFTAARERLPFAFYAVLRRVTEALSSKRHNRGEGAGGGLQATSILTFQPFLSGLLDAIILMLNSLSQELLQSAERFSDLHGSLCVITEDKEVESSHHHGDAALDSSFAEEYEEEAYENVNEIPAEKDFQEEKEANDRWPTSNYFSSEDMIADEAGRSDDEGDQTPDEMMPDGPAHHAAQGGDTWGVVGVKAEPIADEAGRSDDKGDRIPDEMLPDGPEDRVAQGNVWGVLGVKAEPIMGGNGSEDLMFGASATQHLKFQSSGHLVKTRPPPLQAYGLLSDNEPACRPPNVGEPFGDARTGGNCPGSDSTGEGCSDELAGDFGPGPFTCTDCGLTYGDMGKLWRHQAFRHGGKKPYVCDVCRSRFSLVRNLNQHKKIHTGEKPFVCEECGMSFGRKYHLHRHKKTHTIL